MNEIPDSLMSRSRDEQTKHTVHVFRRVASLGVDLS